MSTWEKIPKSYRRLLQAIRVFYPPQEEFSRVELNSKLEEFEVNSKASTRQLNEMSESSIFLERSKVGGHPFVLDSDASEGQVNMGITSKDLKIMANQVADRHDVKISHGRIDWQSWGQVVNHVNSVVGENVLQIASTPNKYRLTEEGFNNVALKPMIDSIFEGESDDVEELIMGAIRSGESETVEFKESLPSFKKKIAHEIVALGNHKGGVLVIGISDEGDVEGVDNISDMEDRVTGIIQESVEGPLPEVRGVKYNGGSLLVIKVSERDSVFYSVNGTDCYKRVGTTTQKMRIDEIRQELETAERE